ncbi:hypothetical protein Tco_0994821 [Tanacetum coccineum]
MTRSKATPNESSSLGTTSGGGPRCQETMGDNIAQTRFENVSKQSNDSLLARGNTLRSDEDRLKLEELMELCTNLQNIVLDLEKTKTTQANEIASLKRRVKKLKKKNRSRTHKLKRLYKVGLTARVESSRDEESLDEDASKQGRINAIDAYDDITLVSVQDDADKEMFDVDALNGEEVFVAGQNENVVKEVVDAAQVSTAATTVIITTEEITLPQALEALKTSKPKVKGIFFQEPGKSTTTTTISSQQSQDKAEFDEEERLAREKAEKEQEANIALIETWDDIQAKINVDHQLAERLQVQEQEELSSIQDDEEEVTINVIPLAVKSPSIVGWKIHKDGRKSYYQIIRADGKSQMYMIFSHMLKSFDKEDLETLYKLVKANRTTGRLRFDLYVGREEVSSYTSTLTMMLEKKLMIDYESEMAYQLLKFIVKQLKK